MQLPERLRAAIERETARLPQASLTEAAGELSDRYRRLADADAPPPASLIVTDAHRGAYLGTRMPATYAAIHRALAELRERAVGLSIRSALDLGAGPGTASWAIADLFPECDAIAQLEQDPALIRLGMALAAESGVEALRGADWQRRNLRDAGALPEADLVLASYALGELRVEDAIDVAGRAWEAARSALVLLEPGTMKGFALLRRLRETLLERGARLLAPCPHAAACPMPPGDWCHFAARCERTPLHRRLKGGDLGYEDEKFSYLLFTRTPVPPADARILRRPAVNPGFIRLDLCEADGALRRQTVTRKEKELWRKARKAGWGDGW